MRADSKFVITPEKTGRLDRFLAVQCPEWSRTRLQKLIESQHVRVDGEVVTPHVPLKVGQTVTVAWPPIVAKAPRPKSPYPMPPIIFEDKYLIVLNKPAGLVVHPAVGHDDGNTLMDIMAPKLAAGAAWPDDNRPGLVHRLDRDTSGVIVMAKTPAVQAAISKQFALRQVKKMYLALVKGIVERAEGSLESNIARHPGMRQRYAVTAKGRWALTKFKIREVYGEHATLLELHPMTGRTHQIRVHVASFGHPVLGDHVYGHREKGLEFVKRHLLHAATLEFTHPKTNEPVKFSAPMPPDFHEAIKLIRLEP